MWAANITFSTQYIYFVVPKMKHADRRLDRQKDRLFYPSPLLVAVQANGSEVSISIRILMRILHKVLPRHFQRKHHRHKYGHICPLDSVISEKELRS